MKPILIRFILFICVGIALISLIAFISMLFNSSAYSTTKIITTILTSIVAGFLAYLAYKKI